MNLRANVRVDICTRAASSATVWDWSMFSISQSHNSPNPSATMSGTGCGMN
ncbi:Uncharacterised protein [Mycobacteroides abscessus subsp. abscessus]|nr:Uncharacterised protein [Mycobacteroides abscessus subsp. abscessus]